MTVILIAFFAVVIAVNVLMATVAVRSFGGTVVDNSYVASQKFNLWLEQARAQDRLGWKDDLALTADRQVGIVLLDGHRVPLIGAQIDAIAQHPLGRSPDIALTFRANGRGRYTSRESIPAGRWQLRFDIRHGSDGQHLLREID